MQIRMRALLSYALQYDGQLLARPGSSDGMHLFTIIPFHIFILACRRGGPLRSHDCLYP